MIERRVRHWHEAGKPIGRSTPDAETAIERAIEHFEIDEAHRSRLIAEPVE